MAEELRIIKIVSQVNEFKADKQIEASIKGSETTICLTIAMTSSTKIYEQYIELDTHSGEIGIDNRYSESMPH